MADLEPASPLAVRAAIDHLRLTRWHVRDCAICDGPLDYVFEEGKIYWENRCYCVAEDAPRLERSCDDVARTINAAGREGAARLWRSFLGARRK